jgi:hypothetical protein
MANTFTASRSGLTVVHGGQRVAMGVLTMTDGSTGVGVNAGFNWVDTCMATPSTANTNGGGVLINTAASAAGDIIMGSCTSGDTFQVVIFGT